MRPGHVPEKKMTHGVQLWAWLPMPLLLMAMILLWALNLPGLFKAPRLLLTLNVLFSTMISLFVACLMARSYLVRGAPGLLLLGCGVLVWGMAGVVGAAAGVLGVAVEDSVNINVTIFNLCALLAAMCHLAGVLCSLHPIRPIRASGLSLSIAYALVLGFVGMVTIAAYDHWTPTFFVDGRGGTPLRQTLLGAATAMFILTAILLWAGNRRSFSPYAYWYALAVALIAIGLFGVTIQPAFDGALNWTGRIAQHLGGVYMLIAAFAAISETCEWGIPLGIALEEARQQHEMLFQASSDGIVMHELVDDAPRGNFLQANNAACRLLGYTAGEMRGLTPPEVLVPEELSRLMEDYREILAQGSLVHEKTLLARDGRRIPTEIHTRLSEHRGRKMAISIIRDITERRRAEEASCRQNATLEGINRILGAALTCQTEEELGVICLNEAEKLTQSQFGFIGEINGQGLQDIAISNPGWDACRILDPAGHRRPPGNFKIHGLYGKVLSSGRSLFTNQPARHPDSIGLPEGHPPLEAFLGVPLTHEGRTIGMIGVGNRAGGFSQTEQDCLEALAPVIVAAFMRKRVESALREANERLTYHMDYSPLAVIEWGADMRLTRWSGEAERIFGWKAEDVLGKRMEDFRWIYEDDLPQVDDVSTELREGTNPRRFSANRNYHKDGSVVECEWYNSSLLDESGKLRSILSLVLDVTARKQAEAALRRANEQLAEADRRKDEFLAMLAHELRNPLAPVRNAVNVLRLAGDREDLRRRQQEIIDRQVAHMARLLDDLLDVSRVTRGKIELRRRPLDLVDVMAHAVEVVTPLVQERRHALHFDPPRGDLRVHADLDRLAQAVGNLLINAAKYTDEGGQIWLEAACESEEAIIRVRDTGVGITPELLPKVFDLFIQADRSIDRSQGGLGIGLTMVQKLVQMHGGTVEARSAGLGQGSEFIIRLPALSADADGQALHPVHSELAYCANTPRRVLVVDDIADAAVSLGELLEIWGHEVRTAHSGPVALELLEPFMPDVVLMDVGMPGMNGCEVARRMRQMECGRKLRLVALTGYSQPQDIEEAHAAGFDHHLAKPVDLEALRKLLAALIPRS